MVVLRRGAVSYERGTPVHATQSRLQALSAPGSGRTHGALASSAQKIPARSSSKSAPAAHTHIHASRQPSDFLQEARPSEFLPPRTSQFQGITASRSAQRNPASRAPANFCQQMSLANSCHQRSPARFVPAARPRGLHAIESLPAEQPSEYQRLRCAQLSASQSQPASSGASHPDVCFRAARTSRGLGPAGSWAPACSLSAAWNPRPARSACSTEVVHKSRAAPLNSKRPRGSPRQTIEPRIPVSVGPRQCFPEIPLGRPKPRSRGAASSSRPAQGELF